ncbi:hypothetical protein Glove_276g12 [Diversispora epigaea]|uniref:Uncharacterized protein n=1 Tax=Diversispora epigaea TaxID=1348612 RepID=A0A397I2U1_9GLOM|nr:hypothetical protein Glove_276g12 [Diversispora epigaea]
MTSYRICQECNQKCTGRRWRKPCNSTHFRNNFDKWTSGNDTVDKFIQDAQLEADYYYKLIQWIPSERFVGIKEIAKGGFVVLKKVDGIGDINEVFLNEVKWQLTQEQCERIHPSHFTELRKIQKLENI